MEHNAIMVLREGKLENILKDGEFDQNQYISFINKMIPECDIGKIDYKLFSAILIAVNNMVIENDMTNMNNIYNYHRYRSLEIGYIYNEIFKVKDTVKDAFKVKPHKYSHCFSNNTIDDGYKRVTIARKKDLYIGEDYNDDIYKSAYEWNRTLKNTGTDLYSIDVDKVTLEDFIKESRSKIYNPIKEFIIDGNFIDVYNERMTINHYYRSIKNAFNLINDNDYLVSLYFD